MNTTPQSLSLGTFGDSVENDGISGSGQATAKVAGRDVDPLAAIDELTAQVGNGAINPVNAAARVGEMEVNHGGKAGMGEYVTPDETGVAPIMQGGFNNTP